MFQLDGQFSYIIGTDNFVHPYYIAVNANNQLLVADRYSHCIIIFAMDGNYVGKFGTHGTGRGQLNSPGGVAIDVCGFILVIEDNNRVSFFDKDGIFFHSFGSSGSGHGQFSCPRQIAISPTGNIYICDTNNKRIQIFSS